jgi:beta-1,4-mannosyl-glycoprotein beta-1,4-N-acetylglucosaminyltransferase
MKNLIIDSFMFFNEIKMLKARLDYLNDTVDYFILVESREVHQDTMEKKKLYYEENKDEFKEYQDKIIHVIVDELPKTTKKTDYHALGWERENYNRNCISIGLDRLKNSGKLQEQDIILVSDLDEFPNKVILKEIIENMKKDRGKVETFCLKGLHFCYSLENVACSDGINYDQWGCTSACTYKDLLELFEGKVQNLKHNSSKYNNIYENSAWHLGWFGDGKTVKAKASACADPIAPTNKSADEWKQQIKNRADPCWCRENYLKYVPLGTLDDLPHNYKFISELFKL